MVIMNLICIVILFILCLTFLVLWAHAESRIKKLEVVLRNYREILADIAMTKWRWKAPLEYTLDENGYINGYKEE